MADEALREMLQRGAPGVHHDYFGDWPETFVKRQNVGPSITVGKFGGVYSIERCPYPWWHPRRWWAYLRGFDLMEDSPRDWRWGTTTEGGVAVEMLLPAIEEAGRQLAASSSLPSFWHATVPQSPEEWAERRERELREAFFRVTWTCEACGGERPDGLIEVVTKKVKTDPPPGTAWIAYSRHVKHCSDREGCRAVAYAIAEGWASDQRTAGWVDA